MDQFEKGKQLVNRCTLRHHMKCVYITGTEVYRDGREGKKTRHWWRMSYIGRACVEDYGRIIGNIYEALFAVPHYMAIAVGNGFGILVYGIRRLFGKH